MALPEKPITRKETYLAKAAGQNVDLPPYPITREEAYLQRIAEGGSVEANPEEEPTGTLEKLKVGDGVYAVPSGGGGGTSDYSALNNKPQINGVTLTGNKTTGDLNISYNDLKNKPVIPDAQVQSDWNQTDSGEADFIKNKPSIPDDLADLNDDASHRTVTDTEKATWNGKSDFSGAYADLTGLPTLGTASSKDVPATGDASSSQVVMGNDSRLTDSRPASDVPSWAKAATKPTYTASEVGAIATTQKGVASGVAELDANGKVPSSQLPSYVDDVIEGYYDTITDRFYTESTFENVIPPEFGKSWVDVASNKSYRWTGSVYSRVDEGVQLGETSGSAYRGDRGKVAYDHSQTTGNPHGTTADEVMMSDGVTSVESAIMSEPTTAQKNDNYIGENFLKVLKIGKMVNVSGRFQVTTQKPATQTYYLFSQLPKPAGDVVSVNNISNVALIINNGYLTSNDAISPGYYNVECTYAEM